MMKAEFVIKNEFEGDKKQDHRFVIVEVRNELGVIARVTVDAGEFSRAVAKPGARVGCALETNTYEALRALNR